MAQTFSHLARYLPITPRHLSHRTINATADCTHVLRRLNRRPRHLARSATRATLAFFPLPWFHPQPAAFLTPDAQFPSSCPMRPTAQSTMAISLSLSRTWWADPSDEHNLHSTTLRLHDIRRVAKTTLATPTNQRPKEIPFLPSPQSKRKTQFIENSIRLKTFDL
jgi:hypothetical protein